MCVGKSVTDNAAVARCANQQHSVLHSVREVQQTYTRTQKKMMLCSYSFCYFQCTHALTHTNKHTYDGDDDDDDGDEGICVCV